METFLTTLQVSTGHLCSKSQKDLLEHNVAQMKIATSSTAVRLLCVVCTHNLHPTDGDLVIFWSDADRCKDLCLAKIFRFFHTKSAA